jgi:DNA (cytosine-5)-methyltransferase 1
MDGLKTIAEAANHIGVSVDTVRRWEKKGLVKSTRSTNNYRLFKIDEIQRVHAKVSGTHTGQSNYKIFKAGQPTKYTTIDLFAGAGGTALGLENAGLKHIMLNEFDKHAVSTLQKNRPDWNVIHDDVANIDFTPYLGKVDIIEGGFPCQTFSYAGKKMGLQDTRGTMFYEFARAVKEARPKIAIGENVRGLLTHDEGRTLKAMVSVLHELGYKVSYKVMRAQYLDVPQKRERLLIFAVRNDIDSPIIFPKEKDYTISIREAIGDRPKSDGQEYSEKKILERPASKLTERIHDDKLLYGRRENWYGKEVILGRAKLNIDLFSFSEAN